MGKKKNKRIKIFDIPDPKNQIQNAIKALSKYKIGETGMNFHSIKHLKPIFAFDYLSFFKTDLCCNSKQRTKEDLLGFLQGLKKVSEFTYDNLTRTRALRFHKVDFNDNRVSLKPKQLIKILAPSGKNLTENELPNLYQFDLQYVGEARAVGFLFKGIFHLVWFDRDHIIYKKKN